MTLVTVTSAVVTPRGSLVKKILPKNPTQKWHKIIQVKDSNIKCPDYSVDPKSCCIFRHPVRGSVSHIPKPGAVAPELRFELEEPSVPSSPPARSSREVGKRPVFFWPQFVLKTPLGIHRHIVREWLGFAKKITSETHSLRFQFPFSEGDWIAVGNSTPRKCARSDTKHDF